jgi:hypothetical protein
MAFRRVGFRTHSCKVAAFAWPELGHPILDVISAVPSHEDFTMPSNPRTRRDAEPDNARLAQRH